MSRRLGLTTGLVVALLALAWPGRRSAEGRLELEATFYATKVRVGAFIEPTFHLRNLSGHPIEAQTGEGRGYGLLVMLYDPSGAPVFWRACRGGQGSPSPAPEDFETLAPGGWSRSLRRFSRVPPPLVPGRHVLRYSYVRLPPDLPSLWARMTGDAEVDLATARLMDRAWRGAVSGEIVFEVY